jgi:hypothetical protein
MSEKQPSVLSPQPSANNLLYAGWARYRTKCIHPEANAEQLLDLQMAFFAGATELLEQLLANPHGVSALAREVREFADQQAARALAELLRFAGRGGDA